MKKAGPQTLQKVFVTFYQRACNRIVYTVLTTTPLTETRALAQRSCCKIFAIIWFLALKLEIKGPPATSCQDHFFKTLYRDVWRRSCEQNFGKEILNSMLPQDLVFLGNVGPGRGDESEGFAWMSLPPEWKVNFVKLGGNPHRFPVQRKMCKDLAPQLSHRHCWGYVA